MGSTYICVVKRNGAAAIFSRHRKLMECDLGDESLFREKNVAVVPTSPAHLTTDERMNNKNTKSKMA